MGEKKTRQREVKFTKRALEALKPPENGRVYVYDVQQRNLAVCISASGSLVFYRTGRMQGRPVRVQLGRYPNMTVEQARKAARVISGDVARGVDPRRKKSKGLTVQDLFGHWIAHAKRHKKTWQDDQRQFDKYMGRLKRRELADIGTADVAKWHAQIGDRHGPYQANRARALLSAMFNVAHQLGYEGTNPCRHVKRFREASRERFLRPDEMRPFFEALKAEPPDWRDFWLLALFTGARRGNVAGMAWKDIDLEAGVWYLPGEQAKSGLPLAVVLSPPAVAILQSRLEQRNGGEWVFPADTASGRVVDPRKSWARVRTRSGISDLRPHDLRRSLGSWQATAGVSLQIIGASLGHQDVKSTAIYSRLQLAPVRQAVNQAVENMQAAGGLLEAPDGEQAGGD